MASKTYIVSTDDTAPDRIAEIAHALREAGFHVTQQLDAIGVIVGSADDDTVDRVRGLPGVAAIEEEQSYQLPPSDDDAT